VAAKGWVVMGSGWLVMTEGWPVTTPRELVWVRKVEGLEGGVTAAGAWGCPSTISVTAAMVLIWATARVAKPRARMLKACILRFVEGLT